MTVEPSVPGKRRCMKCQRLFLSPDRLRIRRCPRCKKGDDDGRGPRTIRLSDLGGAIRHHTSGD